MSIKSDRWITKMSREYAMIEPFADRQVREGVISYGVSSYGYDMRVAPEFKIFTNALSAVVDPKRFDPKSFVEFMGDVCIVPPNSFALASSVEYFRIPRNCLTICVGKSTYARCGIIVNVTPFEPEWEGFVTLEISNTTPLPAKIYANEGLCQVIFFLSDEDCEEEKDPLTETFIRVNLRRQRRCVADFQRHEALPLRFERRDVHDNPAARVRRLAHADGQHVARNPEIFHRAG